VDLKDRKILFELESDCRQSFSRIAKKVGLSKTAVIRRIEGLQNRGIIERFVTTTNANSLGYRIFTIFLKVQGSAKKKAEILDFIKSQIKVGWCVHVQGNWDVILAALTKDEIQLRNLLDQIEHKYSEYIRDKDMLLNIKVHSFPLKYLYTDFSTVDNWGHYHYGSDHSQVKLSKNDIAFLNYIKDDPKAQLAQVSKKINISRDTAIRSLKKLTEQKVIIRFKSNINVFELGYEWNIVLLSLKDKTKRAEILEYIRSHPNFVYAVDCVGKWDLILNIHAKNGRDFNNIYNDFTEYFHDIIRHKEKLEVSKKQKHYFNPVKLE